MEEITSFRKLRNQKKVKVTGISQSLLKLPANRKTVNSYEKDLDITNKNVSMYQYMLQNSHIKENYINWAINLRAHANSKACNAESEKQVPGDAQPYQVFFKKTKLSEIRQALKQKTKAVNTGEYSQYFGRSKSSGNFNKTSKEQINYMNNLRNYQSQLQNSSLQNKKKRFNNDASINTDISAKVLKKSALKKLRDINSDDKENAFDGTHQYPAFTYDILKNKNIAVINSLVKSGDKVSLPSLSWAIGLRSYNTDLNK